VQRDHHTVAAGRQPREPATVIGVHPAGRLATPGTQPTSSALPPLNTVDLLTIAHALEPFS